MSLREAAGRAEISPTYLNQLEAGRVKEPSPHVLYRLARVYGTSYTELMRLAGYVVPGKEDNRSGAATPLEIALRSTSPLTEDERRALLEFLAFLRHRARHGRPPGTDDPFKQS